MVCIDASVCIDATADKVWEHLARLQDIVLWSDAVLTAACPAGHETGVGAERHCRLRGGVNLTERWTEWHDGRDFTYEGAGLPMVRTARNTWSVEPLGQQTLLRTHAEVLLRGGPLGRLMEPLVRRQAIRLGARSLGAFKHLVEHGVPADLPHRRLAAPATC